MLLEAGGDVHGVADDDALPRRRLADDDLAGVQPDAQRDPAAVAGFELLVERGHPGLQL